jgi:hypothetical protein
MGLNRNVLSASVQAQLGPLVTGKEIYACSGSGATYAWLRDKIKLRTSELATNLLDAYVNIDSGRNDTIYLSPDSHTLTSMLTWAKSNSKLIGLAPKQMMNQRARIGHNFVASPMITVSGSGNEFSNIYTMHGYGTGADYIGWTISGVRNAFDHVHFGGPMTATNAGHASYNGVNITGSENYFNHCVFGTDTVPRDEITPNVTLGAGSLTVFEDCIFLAALTDTEPTFVNVLNTSGYTWAIFKRCQFLAFSANHANAMAVAFTFSSGSSADIVLDPGCSFNNVTKLAASASMKYIWTPTNFAATADELNLIAINSATYI